MTAPVAFGLTIRIVGLLVLLYGLSHLLSVIVILLAVGSDVLPIRVPLVTAVCGILVGYYLLRGAPQIQRIAYGNDRG
jgi:hypothetical protein